LEAEYLSTKETRAPTVEFYSDESVLQPGDLISRKGDVLSIFDKKAFKQRNFKVRGEEIPVSEPTEASSPAPDAIDRPRIHLRNISKKPSKQAAPARKGKLKASKKKHNPKNSSRPIFDGMRIMHYQSHDAQSCSLSPSPDG
jgi:hypothetical protein